MDDIRIREQVLDMVRGILSADGRKADVQTDTRLADIGMSSMDMVNLMLGVEATFDLMIPQMDITPENFRSVATIEAMVVRLVGPSAQAAA